MTGSGGSRYQEELSAWVIDQQLHVSYRWLAHVLAVDVDAAKRMLYEFSQAHQELWCTYLIAGHTKKDDYAIKVVPAKQLEDVKQQFAKIRSVHVYSVAPQPTESAATQVAAADNDQLKKALTDANGESLRTNSLGHIRFTGLQIREAGRRQVQVAKVEDAAGDPVRASSLPKMAGTTKEKDNKIKRPATVGAFFSQQQRKQDERKAAREADSQATSDSQPASSQQSNEMASEVENTESQEVDMDIAEEQEASEPIAAAAAAAAATTQPAAHADGGDTEDEVEWDDGSGPAPTRKPSRPVPKPKPEPAPPVVEKKEPSPAKRQREETPVAAPESESEPEATPAEQEAVEPAAETEAAVESEPEKEEAAAESKPRKRGRKKKAEEKQEDDDQPKEKPKVYGAMDHFMADNEAPKPSAGTRRVKRTRMVEKTYMDDKGYLVTENVVEEYSEDEADVPPPAPAPAPAPKASKSAPKASSKPVASASQRSISSFFGKK